MPLSRRSRWNPAPAWDKTSSKTKITVSWSHKAGAYQVVFGKFGPNYNLAQTLMSFMKSQPYGEYDYDPDNKIWYLHEKHIPSLRTMVETLKDYFEEEFIQKPDENNLLQEQKIPVEVWIQKYKTLTGLDNTDRKNYLRWIMKNHPDVGGDSSLVSSVNEAWSNINKKEQKEIEYANT